MPKKKKNQCYAVYAGRQPGIYQNWDTCRQQVESFPNAKFRKFTGLHCKSEAKAYMKTGNVPEPTKPAQEPPKDVQTSKEAWTEGRYIPTTHWIKKNPDLVLHEKEALFVYTDGSAGGYGVWFAKDDRRNFKECFTLPNPTNNRSELMGVIRALEVIAEYKYAEPTQERCICTDSKYVINCLTEWYPKWKATNWKNNTIQNRSLIERLVRLCEAHPVSFYWTPGHSGIEGNEGADKLAGEANEENKKRSVWDGDYDDYKKPSETAFAFGM